MFFPLFQPKNADRFDARSLLSDRAVFQKRKILEMRLSDQAAALAETLNAERYRDLLDGMLVCLFLSALPLR